MPSILRIIRTHSVARLRRHALRWDDASGGENEFCLRDLRADADTRSGCTTFSSSMLLMVPW